MRDYLTIEIQGVEKKLRPSLAAIQAIETAMNMTLGEISVAVSGPPNITLMVETLYQGFIAGDNKMTRNDIHELLEEEGLPEMQLIVASFFTIATAGKKFKEALVETVDGRVSELRAVRLKNLEELKTSLLAIKEAKSE